MWLHLRCLFFNLFLPSFSLSSQSWQVPDGSFFLSYRLDQFIIVLIQCLVTINQNNFWFQNDALTIKGVLRKLHRHSCCVGWGPKFWSQMQTDWINTNVIRSINIKPFFFFFFLGACSGQLPRTSDLSPQSLSHSRFTCLHVGVMWPHELLPRRLEPDSLGGSKLVSFRPKAIRVISQTKLRSHNVRTTSKDVVMKPTSYLFDSSNSEKIQILSYEYLSHRTYSEHFNQRAHLY